VGRTLSRVAGVVVAGALATFAAAPAALAQDETSTSPTETTTPTSETSTSSSPTSTTVLTSESPASVPSSTSGIATADPAQPEVRTTDQRIAPKAAPEIKGDTQEPSKDDDGYQDNTGHGFVGLGGEGVLVIACAAGKPGEVSTQYLSVTGGPDQDDMFGGSTVAGRLDKGDFLYGGTDPLAQTTKSHQVRLLASRMRADGDVAKAAELLTLDPGPFDRLEEMP